MYHLLDGIRVLDMGLFIAGPACAQALADLGADVIKVEKYNGGDPSRANGPWDAKTGTPLYFPLYNRNKRSVTVDFRNPKGVEIVKALIAKSDVLISNFRVGVMEKMGLDYETIRSINPSIIVLEGSGYGQTGPDKDRLAFDQIVSFMGGWFQEMPNDTCIWGPGTPSDSVTALYGAISVLAALINRQKTGKGQYIDLAMIGCILTMQPMNIINYAANKTQHKKPDSSPYGAFKTKDGFVNLNASTDVMYERVKTVIDDPRLHDPKYEDIAVRCDEYDYLCSVLQDWTKTKTSDEVDEIMRSIGVPCGKARTWKEIMENEHIKQRGHFSSLNFGAAGDLPVPDYPALFVNEDREANKAAPGLGEDNYEIFKELVGMEEADIAALPWLQDK